MRRGFLSIVAVAICAEALLAAQQVPDRNFKPLVGAEVDATRQWVGGGGQLLLIADHMPLAGAAAPLAAAFGVTFTNGFAVESFATEADRDAAFAKPT